MLVLSGLQKIIYAIGVTIRYWSSTTKPFRLLKSSTSTERFFMLHKFFKQLNYSLFNDVLVVFWRA